MVTRLRRETMPPSRDGDAFVAVGEKEVPLDGIFTVAAASE